MKTTKFIAAVGATLVVAMSSVFSVSAAIPSDAFLAGRVGGSVRVDSSDLVTDGSEVASITGDGEYTVEWKVDNAGTDKMEDLFLMIPGVSSEEYPDLDIDIEEVSIDGEVLDYSTSREAYNYAYEEEGNVYTRVYFCDSTSDTGVADIPLNTSVKDNITVTFEISGLGVVNDEADVTLLSEGGSEETTEAETTEAETTETSADDVVAPKAGDIDVAVAFAGLSVAACAICVVKRRK